MEDGEDEKCKEDKSARPVVDHSSSGGCGRLSYLTDNQIHMRRIRRRNRFSCTKEIATSTSNEALDEGTSASTPALDYQVDAPIAEVTEVDCVTLNDPGGGGTGQALDPMAVMEVVGEVQQLPPVATEAAQESEAVTPLTPAVEVHDPDNNPVDCYKIPDKLKCLNFKLTRPVRLEPILLQQNDVRNLLDFAREKALSAAPHWQRQGITHCNQFLISIEPISKPLTRIAFQFQAKTENTLGIAQRLVFFYFWFAGLIIEGLDGDGITGSDLGFLISQIRTPVQRIYKLNSTLQSTLEGPVKKLRTWIQPVAKELDEEVYNYLLRLTPPPPTSKLEIPRTDQLLESLDLVATPGERSFERKRPILILTSISTVLLISYEGKPEVGNRKVNSLPIRGGIYVIQGILGAIEKIVQAMTAAASDFKILVGNDAGKAFKSSSRELSKELKGMRTDRGLRHVTATRNLANSIKNLQIEMVQLEKTFEDVQRGVSWIEDALELCLRQAEIWTPEEWERKLRLKKNRRQLLDCFKGQWESSELPTFDEFFGTEDFGEISDSFQIRIPIRNDRMKFLFPDPVQEEEVRIEEEVKEEPLTSELCTIEPDEESVKIASPVAEIQASDSTVCTEETVDLELDPLPPLMVTC